MNNSFAIASVKCHWKVIPFRICSLPGVFCYLMSQISTLDVVSHMEGKHKDQPPRDPDNSKSEGKLNIMSSFATEYQRYLATISTMVKSQAPFIIQPIGPGKHHTLSQLDQESKPHNHCGLLNRKALQSEQSIESNSIVITITNACIIPV